MVESAENDKVLNVRTIFKENSWLNIYKWSCCRIVSTAKIAYLLLVGSKWCLCDRCVISRKWWWCRWWNRCNWRLPCCSAAENMIFVSQTDSFSKSISLSNRCTINSNDGPALTMASWASLWRKLNKSVVFIRTTASPALSPALSAILPVLTCCKEGE